MATLLRDLRLALRTLRKAPAFSAVAVLVLALSLGINTAVFTIVDAMLFPPLAGQAEPLVSLYNHKTSPAGSSRDAYRAFSYPDYLRIRAHREVFSHLLAQNLAMIGVTEGGTTRRVFADLVSSNYFETLGVRPELGRTFTAAEERPGADIPVAIVSHRYWRAHGAPADLTGQTIRINSRVFTIVGVAPAGFTGTMVMMTPQVWLPLGVYDQTINDIFKEDQAGGLASAATHGLFLAGTFAAGLTVRTGGSRLDDIAGELARADAANDRDYALVATPVNHWGLSTNPQSRAPIDGVVTLLILMAAVVLVIACLNLANMMLARGAARRREVAVRLALGARRGQIVRQLLAEGAVLAGLGAVPGLLLAYGGVRLLVASFASRLPFDLVMSAVPDLRVLLATLVFTAGSTIVFGLGPAWKLTRTSMVSDLQSGDARSSEGLGRWSGRNLMVVAQLALALALLTAGGLFTRAALRAASADLGFSLDHELVLSVDPSLAGMDETQGRALYQRLLARLRALPGVEAVSMGSMVPYGEMTEGRRVSAGDAPPPARPDVQPGVDSIFVAVGSDYFRALGLSVRRGREFTTEEEQAAGAPRVAIVDAPLARRLFGDRDPIGRTIRLEPNEQGRTPQRLEIVGVAPALEYDLFEDTSSHLYVPAGSHYEANMNLPIRVAAAGSGDEVAMLGVVRRAIRDLDPQLPVIALRTMRQQQANGLTLWLVRTGARLFTVFGALALLLAAIGVYGVKAYLVARRTREIGIRMALGAAPRDVLLMVLREGLALGLVGLTFGLALSAGLARLVSGLLYDVQAFDPAIFAIAPIVLVLAIVAASWLPARRATRVVPLDALRSE
jgi:predicted permease